MFGAGAHGIVDREGIYLLMTNLALWIILILGSTPGVHKRYEKFIGRKGQKKIAANCVVYAVIFILCIAYLVTETYNPFLYFRF